MKKLFLILLVFCLLISHIEAKNKKRSKIGVASFTNKNIQNSTALTITDLFRSELAKYKKFDVLNRDNMKRLLKEQSLQQTGITDTSKAVKVGKVLNLRYMIFGSVSRLNRTYIITAEMVDIETSKIVVSVNRKFYNIDMADSVVKSLVREIIFKKRPQRVNISKLTDPNLIKKALIKRYTSRKSKYRKHKVLGYLTVYDGIIEKPYAFLVYKTVKMPSGKSVYRVVSNIFISTVFRQRYIVRTARRAQKAGKVYGVYGYRIKPKGNDRRHIENRIYHKNGKATYLEIYVITRDKNWKANKPKKLRIDLR